MDQYIEWNMEPPFKEEVFSVRKAPNGAIYLEVRDSFELTISPALVAKIKEMV